MPVRMGAFRGRSLMLWNDLSPVAHCSKNGHIAAPPRTMVERHRERDEHAERERMPEEVDLPGRHHPQRALQDAHVEVGLRRGRDRHRRVRPVQPDRVDLRRTWRAATSAAKMKKNQAPPLARKYGKNGWPTTFFSVFPLAGIWVCFWWNMMNRCAVISPRIRPGNQQHVEDVHPRDDVVTGERRRRTGRTPGRCRRSGCLAARPRRSAGRRRTAGRRAANSRTAPRAAPA